MDENKNLKDAIYGIAYEMVLCEKNCAGIECERARGRVPHGLYLQQSPDQLKSGGPGFIIVGMNPGRGDESKLIAPRESNNKEELYREQCKWFEKMADKHAFYKNARNFMQILRSELRVDTGKKPNVLWTELVKCPSKKNVQKLETETIRRCANLYLKREVDEVKKVEKNSEKWIIIAIGKDAYAACSLMFIDRPVIGILHTSGNRTRGNFPKVIQKLGEENSDQKEKLRRFVSGVKKGENPITWIGA